MSAWDGFGEGLVWLAIVVLIGAVVWITRHIDQHRAAAANRASTPRVPWRDGLT